MVVEDYMNWPERAAVYERTNFRRVLAVPLTIGKRIVGVLNATDTDKPGLFSPDEIRLAELFADQAALAVENARLLEAERQRADYLEGVTSVSAALRAAANRDQMMAIIADQLERLLQTPHVGIVLRTTNEEVVMQVGRGLAAPLVGVRGPADQGILGEILRSGGPFTTTQASTDSRVMKEEIFRGNENVVGVALAAQDQRIGGIIVARPAPFAEEEVHLLTAVAEMAGNALNRAGVMETLEQRVAERTADLEAANLQLQELDQLKSAFVSNVSHELRSPITNILLYLDLLAEPKREDRRPTYMGILHGEANRLHRLIEDLLTLSRLERGAVALDLEPQVLDALIAEVVAAQEAHALAKHVGLRHEPNALVPAVSVARSPMIQVLTNLIANAVNYSPPGAQVTVATRIESARGGSHAGIQIHNSQPAIPEEDLPHLFERFFRGQTALASGEAGTGLGLAICKEVVELHHGWIDVESAPATGTAFTAWLPLDASAGT
jgi:signal transduction histidine kinase